MTQKIRQKIVEQRTTQAAVGLESKSEQPPADELIEERVTSKQNDTEDLKVSEVLSPLSPVFPQSKQACSSSKRSRSPVELHNTICHKLERVSGRWASVGRKPLLKGAIIYPEPPENRVRVRKLKKGLASDQVYTPKYEEILKRTSAGVLSFAKVIGREPPKPVRPDDLKNILPLRNLRSTFEGAIVTFCGYEKQTPREKDPRSVYPAYLQKGYGGRIAINLPSQKSHEQNCHSLITPILFSQSRIRPARKRSLPEHSQSEDEDHSNRTKTARDIEQMMRVVKSWRPLEMQ